MQGTHTYRWPPQLRQRFGSPARAAMHVRVPGVSARCVLIVLIVELPAVRRDMRAIGLARWLDMTSWKRRTRSHRIGAAASAHSRTSRASPPTRLPAERNASAVLSPQSMWSPQPASSSVTTMPPSFVGPRGFRGCWMNLEGNGGMAELVGLEGRAPPPRGSSPALRSHSRPGPFSSAFPPAYTGPLEEVGRLQVGPGGPGAAVVCVCVLQQGRRNIVRTQRYLLRFLLETWAVA